MSLAHDGDEIVLGRPGHEPGDFGTPEWTVHQRRRADAIVAEVRRAMNAQPRAWPGELERGIPPGWITR